MLCLVSVLFADVCELKELVGTAEQSQFPDCDLLQQLKAAVTEAERCANVAIQLVNRKHRTRYYQPLSSSHSCMYTPQRFVSFRSWRSLAFLLVQIRSSLRVGKYYEAVNSQRASADRLLDVGMSVEVGSGNSLDVFLVTLSSW